MSPFLTALLNKSARSQLAFILNLDQHWFTLRRFGHAKPNIDDNAGDGHWFNLNSFLAQPEWVGKLYLGMVLQQAESEGYSVFAVTQVDPSAPLGLPRTIADEISSTLPEPTHSNSRLSTHRTLERTSALRVPDQIRSLEDEDYELQAALQASLMGNYHVVDPVPLVPAPGMRSFSRLPSDDSGSPSTSRVLTNNEDEENEEEDETVPREGANLDPVAASMARGQLMLQRMKAHQELAQRELWGEGSMTDADAATSEERRARRQREEAEEAEQLRRAIAESEALAQAQGHAPWDDDDADERVDSGNVARPGPSPFQSIGNRVYDDDDIELQAALKASLEHVPQGWEFPELTSQSVPQSAPALAPGPGPTSTRTESDLEDEESILSEDAEDLEDRKSSNAAAETVSMDELRKKRLARFGV
ncbi:hypothetical protein C0993_001680 [Termitomyces sp. T159_Od127]|nr:hypothetical protein C0993_001680 [Termitomyces sp. T159_Od127]